MNLEPRTVVLSRSNFDSAIESFLRTTDIIHDSETPAQLEYVFASKLGRDAVTVKILFTQEDKKPVDQTVH